MGSWGSEGSDDVITDDAADTVVGGLKTVNEKAGAKASFQELLDALTMTLRLHRAELVFDPDRYQDQPLEAVFQEPAPTLVTSPNLLASSRIATLCSSLTSTFTKIARQYRDSELGRKPALSEVLEMVAFVLRASPERLLHDATGLELKEFRVQGGATRATATGDDKDVVLEDASEIVVQSLALDNDAEGTKASFQELLDGFTMTLFHDRAQYLDEPDGYQDEPLEAVFKPPAPALVTSPNVREMAVARSSRASGLRTTLWMTFVEISKLYRLKRRRNPRLTELLEIVAAAFRAHHKRLVRDPAQLNQLRVQGRPTLASGEAIPPEDVILEGASQSVVDDLERNHWRPKLSTQELLDGLSISLLEYGGDYLDDPEDYHQEPLEAVFEPPAPTLVTSPNLSDMEDDPAARAPLVCSRLSTTFETISEQYQQSELGRRPRLGELLEIVAAPLRAQPERLLRDGAGLKELRVKR